MEREMSTRLCTLVKHGRLYLTFTCKTTFNVSCAHPCTPLQVSKQYNLVSLKVSTLLGWEGNHRSNITLAIHNRFGCVPVYGLKVHHNMNNAPLQLVSLFLSHLSHFPSVLWHCWLGDRKGIRSVKKDLVMVCWWWQFDWSFARPIAPVVTTTSIILCFNKHRLTQVHLENGR